MQYYIRQKKQFVSGPHSVADIQEWIRKGKVREDMEFSTDREDWMWGIEVLDLFPPDRHRRKRRPKLSWGKHWR